MSDLLSGLTDPGAAAVGLGGYVHKDAVRGVLTNPTDEQADAVAAAEFALRMGVSPKGYYRMPKWYREGARDTARRWMAAAATGVDDG